MQRYFLVPDFELKPQVYLRVTDNWVELNMRYLVDPKKRRQASSFIYSNAFAKLQGRDDVTIASSTSGAGLGILVMARTAEEEMSPRRNAAATIGRRASS